MSNVLKGEEKRHFFCSIFLPGAQDLCWVWMKQAAGNWGEASKQMRSQSHLPIWETCVISLGKSSAPAGKTSPADDPFVERCEMSQKWWSCKKKQQQQGFQEE